MSLSESQNLHATLRHLISQNNASHVNKIQRLIRMQRTYLGQLGEALDGEEGRESGTESHPLQRYIEFRSIGLSRRHQIEQMRRELAGWEGIYSRDEERGSGTAPRTGGAKERYAKRKQMGGLNTDGFSVKPSSKDEKRSFSQCEESISSLWTRYMHDATRLFSELQHLVKTAQSSAESLLAESSIIFLQRFGISAETGSQSNLVERIQQESTHHNQTPPASLALAIAKLSASTTSSQQHDAIRLLKHCAKSDHSKLAQFILGYCYERGIGGQTKNTHNALIWYKKSASEPNPFPCAMYAQGNLFSHDDLSAVQQAHDLFQGAASFRFVPAYRALGECCLVEGFGGYNEEKGRALLRYYDEVVGGAKGVGLWGGMGNKPHAKWVQVLSEEVPNVGHDEGSCEDTCEDDMSSIASIEDVGRVSEEPQNPPTNPRQLPTNPEFTPCTFMEEKSELGASDLVERIRLRRLQLSGSVVASNVNSPEQAPENTLISAIDSPETPPHTGTHFYTDPKHDPVQHSHCDVAVQTSNSTVTIPLSEYESMQREIARLRRELADHQM